MKDSERLARIEQKLTDFLALHKDQHKELDKKLGPLLTIKEKIEQPVKWAGWMMTLSTGGALAFLGERAARWILAHFSHGGS